jgi:hypothetical protein
LARRFRFRTLRTWISRLLLGLLALVGVASIPLWLLIFGTITNGVVALIHDGLAGSAPPDTDAGSALAGRLGDEKMVRLQSIGKGGWTLACLLLPGEWLDVLPLAGLKRAPDWSEDEETATLLLVGEGGSTLLVPFLRSEMDLAQSLCTKVSPATRLARDGYFPILIRFAD